MAIIEELAKKTSIAGKNSNVIGEKDSPLILRGQGIKIQWGNKFIDLVKNGKINVDNNILKTVTSEEEIEQPGIYFVSETEQVWVNIEGNKINLTNSEESVYISYLKEQQLTEENKVTALRNIGFYYKTLEEAQQAGLTTGIIYIENNQNLFLVKNGEIISFQTQNTQGSTSEEINLDKLYLQDYSLYVNDIEYIKCENSQVNIRKNLILEDGLQSENASEHYGYRLYISGGKSYLDVDYVKARNISPNNISIYPIKYYQEESVILSVSNLQEIDNTKQLQLILSNSNKYEVGNILTTQILLENNIQTLDENSEVITQQSFVIIDFKIESITKDEYTVSTDSEYINIDSINYLVNKSIFYKQGQLPVARIQDHNYDLFDSNTEQTIENISTRIGSLSELDIKVLENNIVEDNTLGIYSNNSILKNSNIIESKQYGTIFKPYTEEENIINYPQYDETLTIPSNITDFTKFNQAIPNIEWIKQLMDLLVPKGTIVMWSGSEIPEGWVMCDGKNGTPNLIGKFIKASDTAGNTGGNNSIILSVDNLPDHQHGISEINTSSDGGNIHTHTVPNQNLEASNTSISDSSIVWKTVPENTEGLSDITTTKGQSLLSLTSGDAYIDTDVLDTDYSHSVNIPEITTSDTTIEAHTHSIESHNTSSTIDANNSEINIEPEYFSLIFIMKL